MPNDQSAEIQRVLDENDLDAEQVLLLLVQTLTARHVDCELRRLGRRVPWQGQPRPNALNATMDALYEAGAKIEMAKQPKDAPQPDVALPIMGGPDNLPHLLMQMLTACQFAAEREAGMGGDDDDDGGRPLMRIVKE